MSEWLEMERQVIAAADRYREVAAAHDVAGLPDSGRHAAGKAVGRSVQLLSFVLRRATDHGVTVERLGELTGLDAEPLRELLERAPQPELISATEADRVAANLVALRRLQALLDAISADAEDASGSPSAGGLDELHDRLQDAWRGWRRGRGATME
jgi:hypothetical protein